MTRIWTLSLGLLAAASLLVASGCDMLNVAERGFFNLKNGGDKTLAILVSDNDQCIIGLHSEVATNTWRNYDIEDVNKGAYLCVDGKAKKVETGKSYVVENGAVVETQGPDTSGAGGLFDF